MDRPLRNPRHEQFAQLVAAGQPASRAYVEAGYAARGATQNASRLMTNDNVSQRVRALGAQRAAQVSKALAIDVDWIRRQYLDVVLADPNDLMRVIVCACRHCYGAGNAWQWRDQREYENALCEWASLPQRKRVLAPKPTDEGGFGWSRKLPPAEDCPQCDGYGAPQFLMQESHGNPLYAGLKFTGTGMEIKIHDRMKALERLGQILGAFADRRRDQTDVDRLLKEVRDIFRNNGRGPKLASQRE